MGNFSRSTKQLLIITEFILERNPTNAVNVQKHSKRTISFQVIREFIPVKNSTNVKTVGKPLLRRQPLFIMREYIVEKCLLKVMNAEKLSEITPLGWNIRKPTSVKNHISLMNVENF